MKDWHVKHMQDTIIKYLTSNPNLISRRKYFEMLRTTVEDSLEVMGYDFDKDVLRESN
jgi:hypothetical protein